MKKIIILIIFIAFSSGALATRNLYLAPKEVIYSLEKGYQIKIRASESGEKLISMSISLGDRIIYVPEKDLDVVDNPVLNEVAIIGGTMKSENIHFPNYIEIGFGASQCYEGKCPSEITYEFKDWKYKGYRINKN